jgi:hypothetical protein
LPVRIVDRVTSKNSEQYFLFEPSQIYNSSKLETFEAKKCLLQFSYVSIIKRSLTPIRNYPKKKTDIAVMFMSIITVIRIMVLKLILL